LLKLLKSLNITLYTVLQREVLNLETEEIAVEAASIETVTVLKERRIITAMAAIRVIVIVVVKTCSLSDRVFIYNLIYIVFYS